MPAYTGDTGYVARSTRAVSHNLTVVTEADLADASSVLNDHHLSGKNAGAQFVAETDDGVGGTTLVVVTALGGATTDAWVLADGTVFVTPA